MQCAWRHRQKLSSHQPLAAREANPSAASSARLGRCGARRERAPIVIAISGPGRGPQRFPWLTRFSLRTSREPGSGNRYSPDGEPALEVLLHLEVLLEDALQVELGDVVALVVTHRHEGVEGPALEEVDEIGVLGLRALRSGREAERAAEELRPEPRVLEAGIHRVDVGDQLADVGLADDDPVVAELVVEFLQLDLLLLL